MNCKICNSVSNEIFETQILNEFLVKYYKCTTCRFIQTEQPYWLDKAYSSAITSLDIGLVQRNIITKPITQSLINILFDPNAQFLDYGGGYGMFVRMMRDAGFDYYRQDIYCENLFAKRFDVSEKPDKEKKFELLTAFEVFEHLEDPLQEMEKMLSFSDNIFFTTCIYPEDSKDLRNWWYIIPETGQHIALYSRKSFEFIASKLNLNYYSHGDIYHLFSKREIPESRFDRVFDSKFRFVYNKLKRRKSLLISDFNEISKTKL